MGNSSLHSEAAFFCACLASWRKEARQAKFERANSLLQHVQQSHAALQGKHEELRDTHAALETVMKHTEEILVRERRASEDLAQKEAALADIAGERDQLREDLQN